MKIQDIVAQIRNNAGDVSMGQETVSVVFFGLDATVVYINARVLAEYGSMGDFLEHGVGLDGAIIHNTINRDYRFAFVGAIVCKIESDWARLQEAYELADTLGYDVVAAGLEADIPLEDIEDAYCGKYYEKEEFVRELFGADCNDLPKWVESYIDWGKLTRDTMFDYTYIKGHIFRD